MDDKKEKEREKDNETIYLPVKLVHHLLQREEPEALTVLAVIAKEKPHEVHPVIVQRTPDEVQSPKPSILKKVESVYDIASIVHCASIADSCKNEELLAACIQRIIAPIEPTGDWLLAAQKTMDATFAIAKEKLDKCDGAVLADKC